MARAGLAVWIGSMLLATAVLAACGDGMPSPAIRSALAAASKIPHPGPCWPLPRRIHLRFPHEVLGQTGRRAQDGEPRALLTIAFRGEPADTVRATVIDGLHREGFESVDSSQTWTFLRSRDHGRFGVRVAAGVGPNRGILYLDVPISAEKRPAAVCAGIPTEAPEEPK